MITRHVLAILVLSAANVLSCLALAETKPSQTRALCVWSFLKIFVTSRDASILRSNTDSLKNSIQAVSKRTAEDTAAADDFLKVIPSMVLKQDSVLQDLQDSKPFKHWLKQTGRKLNRADASAVHEAMLDYVHQWFQRYQSDILPELRELVLTSNLEKHGVIIQEDSGREVLRAISSRNAARLIGSTRYMHQPGMEAAEAAVAKLELRFLHSKSIGGIGRLPVISSQQLEEMGFPGGLNTKWFNKSFLKSADQVYFHIRFGRKGETVKSFDSIYGDHALWVQPEFANKEGWVSPYVMDPSDLALFARDMSPKDYSALKQAADLEFPDYSHLPVEHILGTGYTRNVLEDFVRSNETAFNSIQQKLHLLDFTVEDFDRLVRNQILRRLNDLRVQNHSAFLAAMDILEKGDDQSIFGLLEREVFAPLNLRREWELKIPVAVPPEKLVELGK